VSLLKWACFLFWLAAFAIQPVHADVTPPYGGFFQNYDDRYVTDQFCYGKRDGAACQIPGHVFDGAGAGICRQVEEKHSRGLFITTCQPDGSVLRIDRQFPVSPYGMGYYQTCDEGKPRAEIVQRFPTVSFICDEAPRVVDRFCRGKQEKDACEASIRVNGKPEKVRGVCVRDLDQLFVNGYPVAYRGVFQCATANPIEHDYTRVGPPGETHWLCTLWAAAPGCVLGWHEGIWSAARAYIGAEEQRMAWFMTLLLEVPVVLFFARRWRLPLGRAFLVGVAMSSITHPLAWEAASWLYTESLWVLAWVGIETAVVAIEAGLMRWWLGLTWRRAALLSLLANGFTALVGLQL